MAIGKSPALPRGPWPACRSLRQTLVGSQVGEAWLIDLRDYYARNGTLTRQVRNQAVRLDYRQRGRGSAVVFETIVMRHYLPD